MNKKISWYVLIAMALMAMTAEAQNIPSLRDIVGKVRTKTLPSRSYGVDIRQTLDAPTGSSMGTAIASNTMLRQNTFSVRYIPKKGLYVDTAAQAQQSKALSTPQQPANPDAGNLKVTVDFSKIFESTDEWQNVMITQKQLNGSECYVITGESGVIGFTLWINAADYYVSRVVMTIQGKEFSETDVQCKLVDNGYWLPSEIVIHHALDNTHVTQLFGQYQFQ